MTNPIICAIDCKDIEEAKELITQIKPHIGAIKLGLEFFMANGQRGIEEISKLNIPIFLDLKFHDIPNTVAEAIRSCIKYNIFMLTIHISGGIEMMKAAKKAAYEEASKLGKKPPLIIGVSILTSLDDEDLELIGLDEPSKQVQKLAIMAQKAEIDGIVCSAKEVKLFKTSKLVTVVPGIRPKDYASDDQKRVATASEAINDGADYLVVGRPITQSKNPAKAAKEIL